MLTIRKAVCIRPAHVLRARRALAPRRDPPNAAGGPPEPPAASPVGVACVINFPQGTAGAPDVLAEADAALADGATELDVVLDAAALKAGRLAEERWRCWRACGAGRDGARGRAARRGPRGALRTTPAARRTTAGPPAAAPWCSSSSSRRAR